MSIGRPFLELAVSKGAWLAVYEDIIDLKNIPELFFFLNVYFCLILFNILAFTLPVALVAVRILIRRAFRVVLRGCIWNDIEQRFQGVGDLGPDIVKSVISLNLGGIVGRVEALEDGMKPVGEERCVADILFCQRIQECSHLEVVVETELRTEARDYQAPVELEVGSQKPNICIYFCAGDGAVTCKSLSELKVGCGLGSGVDDGVFKAVAVDPKPGTHSFD